MEGDMITIRQQEPLPVKFEKSFEGVFPIAKIPLHWNDSKNEISFDFEGTGFVLKGEAISMKNKPEYIFHTALYIDGKLTESPVLPTGFNGRRQELCWRYDLPKGKHQVQLKILNQTSDAEIQAHEAIIFSDKPVLGLKPNA
jgi:hypothetical protein